MTEKTKSKIGITLRIINTKDYVEKRDAISHDWIKFLESLNMIPILIPNNLHDLSSYVSDLGLNCVILSGGDDLGTTPERDYTERQLIQICTTNKIPIFGVCRGMQIINDYFGGNLSTDIKSKHVGNPHSVTITNSDFNSIVGGPTLKVNSYHKNILEISNLGTDLLPFATMDEDNTIEGFFHKQHPIVGVMWHPEREQKLHDKTLFQNFVKKGKFWN